MARRGFAALLGANAADDQALHAMLDQPHQKFGAHQRAVPSFMNHQRLCERHQTRQWPHQTAGHRKGMVCTARLHMEHPNYRHPGHQTS